MSPTPLPTPCAPCAARGTRLAPAREAILAATEEILLAEGADHLCIRRVSERCGYKAPTIYHYFGDKAGLLREVVELRFQQLLETLSAVPLQRDAISYLRALSRAFIQFGVEHPAHYRLLSTIRIDGGRVPDAAQAAWDLVSKPVGTLARRGSLGTSDPRAAILATWAMLHGLITIAIESGEPGTEQPTVVDTALDALESGLWRRGSRRR
jgi:AcrR family transcriptional regulator